MTDRQMTCDSVDKILLDILEGDVSAETNAAVNAHVSECARCTALLRDIGNVRERAGAMADLTPSGDLWKGIAARIETPVVALGEGKTRRIAAPVWLAAAASLLVIATSGVTYLVTSRSATSQVPQQSASTEQSAVVRSEAPRVDQASAPVVRVAEQPARRGVLNIGSARPVSNTGTGAVFGPDTVFASEIARLQRVISEKRSDLDPQTVRVVETNLKLIDAAIRSSRAALANDPASGFLNHQLTRALDKKVELLRTVALMPSST